MIIGICGKPGAGKDTIANILLEEYAFKKAEFKTPMNTIVKAVFAVPDQYIFDRVERENPIPGWDDLTVRKILQQTGTIFRDAFGPDIWAKSLWARIMSENHDKWAISDVRTPEDISFIKTQAKASGMECVLVKVIRPGYGATTSGGYPNHKLESYELDSDFLVNNDGSIDELRVKIVGILKTLGIV